MSFNQLRAQTNPSVAFKRNLLSSPAINIVVRNTLHLYASRNLRLLIGLWAQPNRYRNAAADGQNVNNHIKVHANAVVLIDCVNFCRKPPTVDTAGARHVHVVVVQRDRQRGRRRGRRERRRAGRRRSVAIAVGEDRVSWSNRFIIGYNLSWTEQ